MITIDQFIISSLKGMLMGLILVVDGYGVYAWISLTRRFIRSVRGKLSKKHDSDQPIEAEKARELK